MKLSSHSKICPDPRIFCSICSTRSVAGSRTVSIIGRCAQTIHALRILRSQGLYREAVHRVYSSIIIGKLLYAVSSWWVLHPQLIANACRPSYNVAFVVAYAPQKHLTSQNWQNLLMTHYSNASCTTPPVPPSP